MKSKTLIELFQECLILHQDKVAVIEDTGSSRYEITYRDLRKNSYIVSETLEQLCTNCQAKSQFIAVCLDQNLVFPAVILGILLRGYGFACIDPSWEDHKKNDYFQKLGTSVLVHTSAERRSVSDGQQCRVQILGTMLYFEMLKYNGSSRECPHPMAYAVLTSGSTGQPKIVRVPHSSIVPNIIDLVKICDVSSKDVIYLSSPSTFDPSVVDIFMAFSSGASLLVTSKSVKTSPTSLLRVLFPTNGSTGVSVLQMTPSVFNRWSEKELKDVVLGSETSLRVLLLGGEPFPSYSKLMMYKGTRNTTEIFNIYGITEVSPWASIHRVTDPSSNYHKTHHLLEKCSVPLGQPLSDTSFQVRDVTNCSEITSGCGEMFIGSSKRICEVDSENCLDLCSPVFRASGDIVRIQSDGNIYYIGRQDHNVKRWGHRINLEKIENIALSHASVKSACCVWDEITHKLYLIVVLQNSVPVFVLHKHIVTSVGSERVLIPDEILEVNEIPLTLHGKCLNPHEKLIWRSLLYSTLKILIQTFLEEQSKVNRKRISELLDEKSTTQLELLVKMKFAEFLCEVLGLHTLQESSFLSIGGDSLTAMLVITKLESVFGDYPTDLANILLSGTSLQCICEKLCQFYQEKISQPVVNVPSAPSKEADSELDKCHDEKEEDTPDFVTNQDALESFYLRSNSNCGDVPFCSIPAPSLTNLRLSLAWKVDFRKCIDSSPLCIVFKSGKTGIVIGSHSGKFSFLDGVTGEEKWSTLLPDRIESSSCCSSCGQYVYVGCYNGVLYCVHSLSGKIKWSFPTKGMIKCRPVLCNEGKNVIFGAYDTYVYCISSESGELKWRFSEPETEGVKKGNWLASPLVIDELAILCSLAGNVYAVQSNSGTVVWKDFFRQPIFSSPCHYSLPCGNYVVIAVVGGNLYCLEASTGKKVWFWQAPGHIYAPLCTVSKISHKNDSQLQILVSCYDHSLYCFNVTSGNEFSLEWSVNLGASIGCSAFPFSIKTLDGVNHCCVLISNKAGQLFIVSLQDGTICSQYSVDGEVFSSPVVYSNMAYIGCRDNYLYSLTIKC